MRYLRVAAGVLAACLGLGACTSGDSKNNPQGPAQTETSGTPSSSSPSPSATVSLPPGVTLTEAGTQLSFGQTATVEYSPTQSVGSVLGLTVRDATRGRLSDFKGFNLDTDYKKNAHYYYVNVTVQNLGQTDLGGRDVPLAGVNATDTLLPPVVFQSVFPKCPSKKLPKSFGNGASFSTCLVFLSPDKGALTAVSYRPTDTTEPILWKGTVKPPPPVKKKR